MLVGIIVLILVIIIFTYMVDSIRRYGHPSDSWIPWVPEREYEKIPQVSLSWLKSRGQTGDLIVFCGADRDSIMVRTWSACTTSHVGMLLRIKDDDELYIFHSDASKTRLNVLDGQYKEGVQVNNFEAFARSYNGNMFYRKLVKDGSTLNERGLGEFIGRTNGSPFDHDTMILLGSAMGNGRENGRIAKAVHHGIDYLARKVEKRRMGETTKKLPYFCSQLVAEALIEYGVLDGGKTCLRPGQYHPVTFTELNDHVSGVGGCYGPTIPLQIIK